MIGSAEQRGGQAARERLRVSEIFYSLQGESNTIGFPTVFVRLTGCPLRCRYCDTGYAFHGGESLDIAAVLARVAEYEPGYVTVTGGEPLAQRACELLLARLCAAGYRVSLETSGALDISGVDRRISVVMDIKTPGSRESSKHLRANIDRLRAKDQVKFVICDRGDFEWAKERLAEYELAERCEVLFSPSHGELAAKSLAEWILECRLPVRMQVQLHKLLWGDAPGH